MGHPTALCATPNAGVWGFVRFHRCTSAVGEFAAYYNPQILCKDMNVKHKDTPVLPLRKPPADFRPLLPNPSLPRAVPSPL